MKALLLQAWLCYIMCHVQLAFTPRAASVLSLALSSPCLHSFVASMALQGTSCPDNDCLVAAVASPTYARLL